MKVMLSRRNLLTLLSKLDRIKVGEQSACSLIKDCTIYIPEEVHVQILVTAAEDEVVYANREPGEVHPSDEPV